MGGLGHVMDTSLSAMFAAQAGLATVSHNIANAGTPGYSRQQTVFAARRPLMLTFGAIGRGVDIAGIRRMQDEFLLANLRKQAAKYESYATADATLYDLEAILGSVDNDHLGDALTDFFNAWSDLATPPANPGLKQSVVSSAQSLVADFHALSNGLDDMERNIEQAVQQEIVQLNDLLAQVAGLNEHIMAAEVGGEAANDLRDARDRLITEVSRIAEVSVIERDDGSKDVILAGRTMVTRGSFQRFTSRYVQDGDGYKMTVVTQDNLRDVKLSEGRLEGLLTSRDVHVTSVREKLDEVARALIESVNALHSEGNSGLASGLPFFTGDSIHTIDVIAAIQDDPSLVATSRSGAPGDNDIARAIAELANGGGEAGGQGVGDRYRSLLIDLASQRSSFEFLVDNQQNLVGSIEARIARVSGVSMDEEGANMVRYQQTYGAAAKVISTVQELYDTLLNMV
ncbi:MAG: flagellar hook-associated protein FlgK [Candidatus Krumholzibacteriia bacterium]